MTYDIYYICCVCGKTKHHSNDKWDHISIPDGAMISHGYCKDCLKIAKEDIYAELNYSGSTGSKSS